MAQSQQQQQQQQQHRGDDQEQQQKEQQQQQEQHENSHHPSKQQKQYHQHQRQHQLDDNNNNNNNNTNNHIKTLHVAPMLDVTNREFRQLMRILSTKVVLWTEMVVDETIIYTNDLHHHLSYDNNSHPIVCQIGGDSPDLITKACQTIIQQYNDGYYEININMGCPSDRVASKRQFGAILMKKLDVAEKVVQAMQKVIQQQHKQQQQQQAATKATIKNIPKLSVKCRIGIDDLDSYEYMVTFIERLSPYCDTFYLHARKCLLGGLVDDDGGVMKIKKLTPAQNRSIPPLNYPRVYDICRQFPKLQFYINGGIQTLDMAKEVCFGVKTKRIATNMDQHDDNDNDDDDNNNNNNDSNNHHHHHHQVPCTICGFENGSCIAALLRPPSNLKGCQMGRACRDNPCVIATADTSFYNLDKNPCRNRREVLQKYCHYLETLYPRRCCDIDENVTTRVVVGARKPDQVVTKPEYDCCPNCVEYYQSKHTNDVNGETTTYSPPLPSPTASSSSSSFSIAPTHYVEHNHANHRKGKFTVHVLYRCARPILGIFFGIPKAPKAFRREMDRIIQKDLQMRNCGPSILIQKALKVVPDDVLDQEFV